MATDAPLLVFGDDGAPPADTAWRWITNQPWPGWHVDVLTADTEGMPIEWGKPPRSVEWTPAWARTENVTGADRVRFLKVATDARAMLAERDDADLIVLGLRTHTFLEGFVTGSTTEWLLHHPPAPMVVARSPETVRKAVVCVDESDHARAALDAFAALPLSADTAVTILSVDDGRTDTARAVEAASTRLEGMGEPATTVVEGTPTLVILEHVEQHRPELVVLGTAGLTGWRRLRLGSTASAVVRSVPCSSLIASAETR